MNRLRAAVALGFLALSSLAFAERKPPKEFEAPPEDAPRARKSKIGGFIEDPNVSREEPFPWVLLLLVGSAAAIAVPFGYKTWKSMEAEHAVAEEGQESAAGKRARVKTPEKEE